MLKRSLISIAIGISIAVVPMIVIAALGFPEKGIWERLLAWISVLSYWPLGILHPPFTTLDCRNTESIVDKANCVWISCVISAMTYSILCVALLSWLASKKQTRT